MFLFCQADLVNHNMVFHSQLCCLITVFKVWISFVLSGLLIQSQWRTWCSFTLCFWPLLELFYPSMSCWNWSSIGALPGAQRLSCLDSTASHMVYFTVCAMSHHIAIICTLEPHWRPKQRRQKARDQLRVWIRPVRWQMNPAVCWLKSACWMFSLCFQYYCRWQRVKALCKLWLGVTE